MHLSIRRRRQRRSLAFPETVVNTVTLTTPGQTYNAKA
jgi:hypothetical protein